MIDVLQQQQRQQQLLAALKVIQKFRNILGSVCQSFLRQSLILSTNGIVDKIPKNTKKKENKLID